jgi:curved DNA-binding protein CbpA
MKSINEYCKILGVDSSVTAEELKKVYRELVKEWHPDRLLHNPSLHKTAQQKLQEINEAYDQLQALMANPNIRLSAHVNEPSRDTTAGRRKANNATAKRPVAPATQFLNRYVAFWRKHRVWVWNMVVATVKDPWIIAAFILMLVLAVVVDWF